MDGFEFVCRMLERFPKDGCNRLLRIAGNQETSWLELKSACYVSDNDDMVLAAVEADRPRVKKEEQQKLVWAIAKSILAMHNAQGGVILVGVDPSVEHKVCPIEKFSDPKKILTGNSTKDDGDYLEDICKLFDRDAFRDGRKRLPIRLDRSVYEVDFAQYKLQRILAILVKSCAGGCAIPVLTIPEVSTNPKKLTIPENSYYYRQNNCSKPLPFSKLREVVAKDLHTVSFDRLWNGYRFSWRDAVVRWFLIAYPLGLIAIFIAVIFTFVCGPSWSCFWKGLAYSAGAVFLSAMLWIASGWHVPNFEMKTKGGEFYWADVKVSSGGWRIQRHRLFFWHCRLLDPDNYRKAHGLEYLMERVWKRMVLDDGLDG